jgi:hypothetical protein
VLLAAIVVGALTLPGGSALWAVLLLGRPGRWTHAAEDDGVTRPADLAIGDRPGRAEAYSRHSRRTRRVSR